ncbi:DUF7009 family protein [Dyella jiangningensis]|uniref:Uncharacterized protein n=1 Tax=Dyella jiangningensis TaxID=1379159 RepID=A0A328P635_9GAMM|nr:hypothetical protein [Dyella jiangningensis]RAO77728.1 hypothetical protein CA260_07665 [Dyella jiangningensis]
MKLQIEGQSLRVRIGEAELAQLLAGGAVQSQTRLASAFTMECALRLVEDDEARLSGRADAWLIELPGNAVREHAARLPTREGLTFVLPTGDGDDALELLFDVDVRDSVRQRRSS